MQPDRQREQGSDSEARPGEPRDGDTDARKEVAPFPGSDARADAVRLAPEEEIVERVLRRRVPPGVDRACEPLGTPGAVGAVGEMGMRFASEKPLEKVGVTRMLRKSVDVVHR